MEDSNEVYGTLSNAMSELTVARQKQETCEEMLSRHRKEISELQNKETDLQKQAAIGSEAEQKAKKKHVEEEIYQLSVKLKETHAHEIYSLGYNNDGKDKGNLDTIVTDIAGVPTTNQVDHAKGSKPPSKSVKRHEKRAQQEAPREQRVKEEQSDIVSDWGVESVILKRKLEPLGLIVNEIKPDSAQKVIQIGRKLGRLNLADANDEQPRKKVRSGAPETQWISIYNGRKPMNQRYHYNVYDSRLAQHVERGTEDGLFISCVSSYTNLWTIIMDDGTSFTSQVCKISPFFLDKEWIMEQWEKNYCISAIAGSINGSSLVVMSKGTVYSRQSYKVSWSFPLKWIDKKWKEGFHVTSMATAGARWAVVMSQNAGYSNQVVEFDFLHISEGVHKRWDTGYRITCVAASTYRTALILSVPKRRPSDETQETLRTSQFPFVEVKENQKKNLYLSCLCYGRIVSCDDRSSLEPNRHKNDSSYGMIIADKDRRLR